MKIGIIVHSQSGNTLSVAEKLQEKLTEAGHSATIERLQTIGEAGRAQTLNVAALPSIEQYDALVFGAPVQAFSLSSVMNSYMGHVNAIRGKRVALLITQHFPYAWMGGNRALGQLRKVCESRGATVCGSGIVNWARSGREQQIGTVVETLSRNLCTFGNK